MTHDCVNVIIELTGTIITLLLNALVLSEPIPKATTNELV
jgi:hypothetical protein